MLMGTQTIIRSYFKVWCIMQYIYLILKILIWLQGLNNSHKSIGPDAIKYFLIKLG